MFDIGGWEFFLILLLALLIIGPKDLPVAIRTVTQWIRRARMLARDFQSGLDDLAAEAELDKVKKDLASETGLENIQNEIHGAVRGHIDPDGEIEGAINQMDDPLGIDNGEDDEAFVYDPPELSDLKEKEAARLEEELENERKLTEENATEPEAEPASGDKKGDAA